MKLTQVFEMLKLKNLTKSGNDETESLTVAEDRAEHGARSRSGTKGQREKEEGDRDSAFLCHASLLDSTQLL